VAGGDVVIAAVSVDCEMFGPLAKSGMLSFRARSGD
jgi:hypothetical protein